MYQFIDKVIPNEKRWYLILAVSILVITFLVTVVYKNENLAQKDVKTIASLNTKELNIIKEFFFKKINSPFFNINYEIKSGDSIQKILKKFKIPNNQIQNVIEQYKKYSNPNKLLAGDNIDIVIEKKLSVEENSISKFSIPISKLLARNVKVVSFNSRKIFSKIGKEDF